MPIIEQIEFLSRMMKIKGRFSHTIMLFNSEINANRGIKRCSFTLEITSILTYFACFQNLSKMIDNMPLKILSTNEITGIFCSCFVMKTFLITFQNLKKGGF
jgi:hypothetical protein